jgi:hypothetical protein
MQSVAGATKCPGGGRPSTTARKQRYRRVRERVYRHGLAAWHVIIDGLAKPTFVGVLPLSDLAGAVAEARAAVLPDPRQAALKRSIAEIRAWALSADANAVAG